MPCPNAPHRVVFVVLLSCVVLCCFVLCDTVLFCLDLDVLCHGVLYYFVLGCGVLYNYFVGLFRIILRCVRLSYFVWLGCNMLCYVVPCCDMQFVRCCIVLCNGPDSSTLCTGQG